MQPGLGCSKALAAPPDLVERSTGRNRMVDGRLVHEAMARPGDVGPTALLASCAAAIGVALLGTTAVSLFVAPGRS